MGKKKKKKLLPFLSWPWPSCQQNPRTLSFKKADNTYVETPDDSSASSSFEIQLHSPRESFSSDHDSVESVVRGLSSDKRLFFEPRETSSILKEASYEKSTTATTMFLSIESTDPLMDFKNSMEEMVEANGYQNDWEGLEKLLCCYLRVNAKTNHGYISSAFLQLVGELAVGGAGGGGGITINDDSSSSISSSSVYCSCSQSPSSSPLSNFHTSSSASSSSLKADDVEIHHLHRNVCCSSPLVEINEIVEDYCCYMYNGI